MDEREAPEESADHIIRGILERHSAAGAPKAPSEAGSSRAPATPHGTYTLTAQTILLLCVNMMHMSLCILEAKGIPLSCHKVRPPEAMESEEAGGGRGAATVAAELDETGTVMPDMDDIRTVMPDERDLDDI